MYFLSYFRLGLGRVKDYPRGLELDKKSRVKIQKRSKNLPNQFLKRKKKNKIKG